MLTTRASAAGLAALKSASRRSDDTRQNPFLLSPHRRFRAHVALRMVVAKHMKGAVHDKSQELLLRRNSLPPCVCPRNLGTDVDVTDGCSATALTSKRERYHVGRPVMTEV